MLGQAIIPESAKRTNKATMTAAAAVAAARLCIESNREEIVYASQPTVRVLKVIIVHTESRFHPSESLAAPWPRWGEDFRDGRQQKKKSLHKSFT